MGVERIAISDLMSAGVSVDDDDEARLPGAAPLLLLLTLAVVVNFCSLAIFWSASETRKEKVSVVKSQVCVSL